MRPRSGGDLSGWKRLLAHAHKLDRAHVKIGVLSSKGGDQPHGGEGEPISMIELAATHEFGSPAAGIPERSFIRRTFAEQAQPLAEICAKLARAVVSEKMGVPQALALLGQWGVAAVRRTVTEGEGVPPPNAESTIAAKGSSRPLVDTGRLLQAVSYDVAEGEP